MSFDFVGDLSTVVKFVVMTVAPALGVDEVTGDALVSVVVAVVGFLLAYVDARYPNSLRFLGNGVEDGDDDTA